MVIKNKTDIRKADISHCWLCFYDFPRFRDVQVNVDIEVRLAVLYVAPWEKASYTNGKP